MHQKIKKYLENSLAQSLRDSRSLGLLAFGVIALLVTWSGVKAVQNNYDLQKQISKLEQQNEVTRLENENQKLRNEYYKTDEFLELSARRQFARAAPGERLYLVPKNVALAHTVDLKNATSKNSVTIAKPTYRKNFEAWINFFLHRPSVNE